MFLLPVLAVNFECLDLVHLAGTSTGYLGQAHIKVIGSRSRSRDKNWVMRASLADRSALD